MISHLTITVTFMTNSVGESRHVGRSIIHFKSIYNLTTLCVHDILSFMFMFMFQFVFIFHIIFMFHEHIYTYCISYIFLVSCLLHMEFYILVRYDTYVFTHHSCILIPL